MPLLITQAIITTHRASRRAAALTLSVALSAHPTVAAACPVCFSAKGESLAAFYGTAILMTLTPLAMFGSISFYIYRRTRVLR